MWLAFQGRRDLRGDVPPVDVVVATCGYGESGVEVDIFVALIGGRLFEAIDVEVVKSNNPNGATAYAPGFYPVIVAVEARVREFDDERSSLSNPFSTTPLETERLQTVPILRRQVSDQVQVRFMVFVSAPKFLCGAPNHYRRRLNDLTQSSRKQKVLPKH